VQTRWWRDAVIYEIYIRSFADGGGDGVGDIAGIRSRLPYLRDLGVDAIWITPWYRSPMADGGYDVADYRDIDPLFGTLADAEALIRETHEHGMRLLVDIVPNHTSDRHAWFQAALAAEPGSPERARYHFRDGQGPDQPPNNWRSVFGGPAWSRVPDGQWYLHLFAPQQPDLNWTQPDVRAEFADILRFWLDRGVDGFRIDVANGLAKDPDLPDVGDAADHPYWDRDEVHDIYRSWRRLAESYGGDRIFVAEAWVDDADRLARYVRQDELHTAFNFNFLRCPWDAGSFRSVIDESLRSAHAVGAPATWVLSNHDVTRHVTRYGRARTSGVEPINAPRVPSDIETGTRRARAALLLMLALPGSAYLYQARNWAWRRSRICRTTRCATRRGRRPGTRSAAATAAEYRCPGADSDRRSVSGPTTADRGCPSRRRGGSRRPSTSRRTPSRCCAFTRRRCGFAGNTPHSATARSAGPGRPTAY
jgi:alpha-glucosidase